METTPTRFIPLETLAEGEPELPKFLSLTGFILPGYALCRSYASKIYEEIC